MRTPLTRAILDRLLLCAQPARTSAVSRVVLFPGAAGTLVTLNSSSQKGSALSLPERMPALRQCSSSLHTTLLPEP